jgi:hypothetical protein
MDACASWVLTGPLSLAEVEERFDGNICRCTGYRPIMTAFHTFADEAAGDSHEVAGLAPFDFEKCVGLYLFGRKSPPCHRHRSLHPSTAKTCPHNTDIFIPSTSKSAPLNAQAFTPVRLYAKAFALKAEAIAPLPKPSPPSSAASNPHLN